MKGFTYILDWIYPPRCIFCRDMIPIDQKRGICQRCREALPWVGAPTCKKCGRPLEKEGGSTLCPNCLQYPPLFDQGWGALHYDDHMKGAVYRFKYGEHPEYASVLGELMGEAVRKQVPNIRWDHMIPVPMEKRKQKKRGYNQAALLAKSLEPYIGVRSDERILIRTKETKPQSGLSLTERKNNVKNAFSVLKPEKIRGKNMLLIDDIYTTGSTMDACTKELIRHGARSVSFLTLCIGSQEK